MVRTVQAIARRTAPGPVAAAADGEGALPGRRSWHRWLPLVGGLSTVLLAATAAAVAYQPAALRAIAPDRGSGATADAEAPRLAGRLITTASALRAAALRPGDWEALVTADEVNAWLRHDLPRNHPHLLPAGWLAPRVAFADDRCWLGVVRRFGPFPVLVWLRAAVRPRDGGAIELAVDDAGIGAVPLPADALLARIGDGLRGAGYAATVGRLDGANRLLVRPAAGDSAGAGIRLEAVLFRDGEALITGRTVAVAPRR